MKNNVQNAGRVYLSSVKSSRWIFIKSVTPIAMSIGDVPATGIAAKNGPKNMAPINKIPQTTALRPVLAPAAIPAAVSELIVNGGPKHIPLHTFTKPIIRIRNCCPGTDPSSRIEPTNVDNALAMPKTVKSVKNIKEKAKILLLGVP